MTSAPDCSLEVPVQPGLSLAALDPAHLLEVRVLPAEFSRMLGVSRQTVSQWIHKGIVTLPPDGRLNPTVAARAVIARTDPARLRARVFKAAMQSQSELRERIRDLESQLADARSEVAGHGTRFVHVDHLAILLGQLQDLIAENFGALVAAAEAGSLDRTLDDFVASVFWPDALVDAAAAQCLEEPEESLPSTTETQSS